jgi:hypothetical protein
MPGAGNFMDFDRIWKWVERTGFILNPTIALGAAYYAAGVYNGWDKQEAAKTTTGPTVLLGDAAMTLPWPIITLSILAALLMLTSWTMIAVRIRRKTPKEKILWSGAISLNEIQFDTSRFGQPSPWLQLHLTLFNATGYVVAPSHVIGRLIVSGQEFHGLMELSDPPATIHGLDRFIKIGLKIPVSSSEAEHAKAALKSGHLFVDFSNAAITFQLYIPDSASEQFTVNPPLRVHFNTEGRTDPYLPWQMIGA